MKRALLSIISIITVAGMLSVLSYQAFHIESQTNTADQSGSLEVNNTSPSIVVPPTVTQPTLPTPVDVTVVAVGTTSTLLTWKVVSADHGSLVVYQVWRNGQKIATVTRPTFFDVFLVPGQELSYVIVATTAEGAVSPVSTVARITLPTTSGTPTPQPTPKPTANTNTTPQNTNTGGTKNTNTSPAPTPTPTPTPTPVLACGSGGSCSSADVAKHGTRSNCWVYLSPLNKVYNITSYVSNGNKHPGGDVIAQYCGQNIYSYFIGSAGGHRHSNSALNSTLQAFYIAPFKP